jgi:hypothetical protein
MMMGDSRPGLTVKPLETGPNRVLFFETCTPILNQGQGNPFRRNDFSAKSTPGQPGRPMPGTRFGPLSVSDADADTPLSALALVACTNARRSDPVRA